MTAAEAEVQGKMERGERSQKQPPDRAKEGKGGWQRAERDERSMKRKG